MVKGSYNNPNNANSGTSSAGFFGFGSSGSISSGDGSSGSGSSGGGTTLQVICPTCGSKRQITDTIISWGMSNVPITVPCPTCGGKGGWNQ